MTELQHHSLHMQLHAEHPSPRSLYEILNFRKSQISETKLRTRKDQETLKDSSIGIDHTKIGL